MTAYCTLTLKPNKALNAMQTHFFVLKAKAGGMDENHHLNQIKGPIKIYRWSLVNSVENSQIDFQDTCNIFKSEHIILFNACWALHVNYL